MESSENAKERAWKIVGAFCHLVMTLGIIASVLALTSLAGYYSPVADLFSHFRWQYGVSLAIAALIACVWKKRKYAVVFATVSVINLALVGTLWLPDNNSTKSAGNAFNLKILNMNLLYENRRSDLVAKEIARLDPDVLVFEEFSETMYNQLSNTLTKYPHSIYELRFDAWGIGIFSKYELTNKQSNLLKLPHCYVTSADVLLPNRTVTIIGMHTVPQLSMQAVDTDKLIIDGLTAFNKLNGHATIMIGDFNATPWSAFFGRLKNTGNLLDSERGFGAQLSWPVGFPILMIPIDHCVHTSDCAVIERKLGNFDGSDHFPLFLRFAISDERGKDNR